MNHVDYFCFVFYFQKENWKKNRKKVFFFKKNSTHSSKVAEPIGALRSPKDPLVVEEECPKSRQNKIQNQKNKPNLF